MKPHSENSTTIIAVRHGETEWNRVGMQQGHLDSPLTQRGVDQACAMAEALSGMGIQTIYSSDLGRALRTAEVIAGRLQLEVLTDIRLRERNLGIMEGLTMAEFCEKHPADAAAVNWNDPDYVIPQGESSRQLFTRNVECVEDITRQHPGATVLVVVHGGVLKSFFHRAVQTPLEVRRSFSLFNGAINTFTVAGSRWRLETWGDIVHLRGIPSLDDT